MILIIETTQRKMRIQTFRLLGLLLMVSPILGFASVLSDLAATVAPGEFVELEIDGSISTCDALIPPLPLRHPAACTEDDPLPHPPGGCLVPPSNSLGNLLEFTDKAQWDSIGKEVYIIGTRRPYRPWDQAFVKYSEATNSWIIMDRPPFGFGPHGYDHNAMDVVGRKLYQTNVNTANRVWSMDMDTNVWHEIRSAPIQAGQFAALDYFPELNRMVFFDGLGESEYALYNSATNTWEGPTSLAATPFGGISHFSEYSVNHGVMFFGGGYNYTDSTPNINERRRFYMLDENQVAHRLADPPTFLGQFGAGPVQTIDPNTGNLIVFQGKPNEDSEASCPSPGPLPIWEYDFLSNTWGQTGTQTLTNLYCTMNTVAAPLYEYGVSFVVSVKSQTNCKVYLYRHSPMEAAPPSITTQPTSQSAEEGSSATFSLTVSGSGPLDYQWYRDDVMIVGATNSSLVIEPVTIGDDGARYHSTVTNSLGNVVSEYATLSVIPDITAPLIAGAFVRNPGSVDIEFSEVVSTITAQTIANYQISAGIQITAASLNADGKTVHLQTGSLEPDTVYVVTVNNIQDVSAAANEILPNSTVDILFSPVINFDTGLLPLDWIPLNRPRWSVVENNGNNALFLNTTDYSSLPGNRLGEYILSPDSYGDFTLAVEAKTNESSGNANADYALVFGFQDENNYYYMLFNRIQSNTVLFRVANGSRQELAVATNDWLTDNEYHTVEVRHMSGNIEIRFDGNVVLEFMDATLPSGQIGLGSFNDSSYFDDIRISAGIAGIEDLLFTNSFE